MRKVAGRRQSCFAECLAKRANGEAIVSDGRERWGQGRVGKVSRALLEGIKEVRCL